MEAYCRGIDLGFATAGTPWELRLLGAPEAAGTLDVRRRGPDGQGGRLRLAGGLPGRDGALDRRVRPPRRRPRPSSTSSSPASSAGSTRSCSGGSAWTSGSCPRSSGGCRACRWRRPRTTGSSPGRGPRRGGRSRATTRTSRSTGSPPSGTRRSSAGGRRGRRGTRWGRRCRARPAIVIGRTPELAWAVTYACMDCVDSWVEECRDGRYRRGDGWHPFRVREETIERRRRPPVVVAVLRERARHPRRRPAARRASTWRPAGRAASGPGPSRSTGWSGIARGAARSSRAAPLLAQVGNSSWSWLLADRGGSIGFQMSGKMPLRRPGVSGLVPLPGWDPANDWRGFARPEDLPRALDPPEGFLATANDDLNALGVAEADQPVRRPRTAPSGSGPSCRGPGPSRSRT